MIYDISTDLFPRHQEQTIANLQDICFDFGCMDRRYYGCNKILFKGGESNTDSFIWFKTKKATVNLKNEDDERFR